MPSFRRAALGAAIAAAPFALAWRFALIYRVRAGYPRRNIPQVLPSDIGLPFEELSIPSEGAAGDLPAWFIPARDGAPGPGVVLIHGWESARDRTLPMVQFLHAAGFHCLTIDVRGHGANPAEALPLSAGEFGIDALAAFQALIARPEVTRGAISGHSMGATGALLAAAADQRVAAVVATSPPSDPYRLTRQTFRLARLPIPDPIAWPLAWLTTRLYLRPRGHRVAAISASTSLATLAEEGRPVLLAHGDADDVVPIGHHYRLDSLAAMKGDSIEAIVLPEGRHSWLYEFPAYRAAVARFLAVALGGPYEPDEAAERAAAVAARRIPDSDAPFGTLETEPGGFRSLAGLARRNRVTAPGTTTAEPMEAAEPAEAAS